jgi:hypothetical protein
MAQLLDINIDWYCDLEQYDDELVSTLSVNQATHLATALGVGLRNLLGHTPVTMYSVPLAQLPDRIRAHIAGEGVSFAEFEDRVGWELRGFMDAPESMAADTPIMFLQDLAKELELDWLSLVPDSHAL